jgi:outer membrane lipoprotein-sorting protein
LAVVTCVLLTAAPCRSSAQDGKAIIQNMIKAYRNLESYRGLSKGTVRQESKKGELVSDEGFSTVLTYVRPNMLKVEFVMPSGGRAIYCDGHSITFFQNQNQTFAGTDKNMKDMHDVAAALLELQIAGRYDVLYFLSGNTLPSNVTGIQRMPDSLRNNRPVYVVTAHETTRNNDIKWTWMIDKQTMMLARVEGRTWNRPGTVRLTINNSPARNKVPIECILAQSILTPKINEHIGENEFRFRVPQNFKSVKYKTILDQQRREFSGSSAVPASDN